MRKEGGRARRDDYVARGRRKKGVFSGGRGEGGEVLLLRP